MKFFGKKATFNDYGHDQIEYFVILKNTDDLVNFYDNARSACTFTNFGLNPCEWAAYGEFELDGKKYVINSPKQLNGDNNWWKYPEMSKRRATIRPYIS